MTHPRARVRALVPPLAILVLALLSVAPHSSAGWDLRSPKGTPASEDSASDDSSGEEPETSQNATSVPEEESKKAGPISADSEGTGASTKEKGKSGIAGFVKEAAKKAKGLVTGRKLVDMDSGKPIFEPFDPNALHQLPGDLVDRPRATGHHRKDPLQELHPFGKVTQYDRFVNALGRGVNQAKTDQSMIGDFAPIINLKKIGTDDIHGVLEQKNVDKMTSKTSNSLTDDTMDIQLLMGGVLSGATSHVLKEGKVGASMGLKYQQQQTITTKETVIEVSLSITKHEITLFPAQADKYVDPELKKAYAALPHPNNPDRAREWFTFFNRYGTHFVRAGEFGGELTLKITLKSEGLLRQDAMEIESGIEAALNSAANAGITGGSKSTFKDSQVEAIRTAVVQTSVKGGKPSLQNAVFAKENGIVNIGPVVGDDIRIIDSVGFQEWKASLAAFPVLVNEELGRSHDPLQPTDPIRAKTMEVWYNAMEKQYFGWKDAITGKLMSVVQNFDAALDNIRQGFRSDVAVVRVFGKISSTSHMAVGAVMWHSIRDLCMARCELLSKANFINKMVFDEQGERNKLTTAECASKLSNTIKSNDAYPYKFSNSIIARPLNTGHLVPLVKTGIVLKKGKGPLGKWMRRQLRLSKNALTYSHTLTGPRKGPSIEIQLKGILAIFKHLPPKKKTSKAEIGFCIVQNARLWQFRVDTIEERDAWVEALVSHSKSFGATASINRLKEIARTILDEPTDADFIILENADVLNTERRPFGDGLLKDSTSSSSDILEAESI